MPYIKKADLDVVKEKAEEILHLFSQNHYYKAPGEDRIIANTKDIIKMISEEVPKLCKTCENESLD